MLRQLLKYSLPSIYMRRQNKLKDMPAFLQRMSTLLGEGYTFSDSISILLPYHVEKVDDWSQLVHEKLRNGAGVIDILQCLAIPKQYLLAIQIAEENGEMSSALQTIANQMTFHETMRKKLSKLLSYPIMLMLFLVGIFIAFRTYFFPNIEHIILSKSNEQTSLTVTKIFLYFPDYFFLIAILLVIVALTFFFLLKKQSVRKQFIILLKVPVVSYLYKLQMTRQFARFLGSLLVSGFSLQQALQLLQQQQLNHHLSYVAATLEKRIVYGDALSTAVTLTPCFFSKFEDFIKHGEKSGYLGRELLIYCELLDEKLQSIVKTSLSIIQPFFFIIIALCIVAAYLSILLPMYNIIDII